VTLLTNGGAALPDDDRARLAAAGIAVDERRVASVRGSGDELSAVLFADGSERPCGGLLVGATLHQRSDLAAQLGLAFSPPNPIAYDAVVVGPMGETSVPGVVVAGDAGDGMPSVANAVAEGSNAAASIVRSLMEDPNLMPQG